MGELLKVENLNVYYGSIHAIKDLSLTVNEGEIVTMIGANGAGKTTTMHAISGLLKPRSGSITYDGHLISRMDAYKIVTLGLAQCPEGRRVFSGLTVHENLELGAYSRKDSKAAVADDFNMVFELLPRLKERRNQLAGTLSGGEQQMLAMGRALMSKPRMLLLDEPSMGLSPLLVKEIFRTIKRVRSMKTASQSFWWSRMRRWHSTSQTADMSSRQAALPWKARHPILRMTRR